MREDWAAGIRSLDAYKDNICLCRIRRREDAKKLPGLQMLREYPALGLPEIVSSIIFRPAYILFDLRDISQY